MVNWQKIHSQINIKTNNTESIAFNSKLTYTEPLSKVSSLVFNYGVNVSNSKAVINSYNKANEKYTMRL